MPLHPLPLSSSFRIKIMQDASPLNIKLRLQSIDLVCGREKMSRMVIHVAIGDILQLTVDAIVNPRTRWGSCKAAWLVPSRRWAERDE